MMREIGWVKICRCNVWIIGREEKLDLKVDREQILCSKSDLIKGIFVTFEIKSNTQNGEELAQNLRLFKEIGKIKWFGGYNSNTGQDNDYGFIECDGRQDIWVHQIEIGCSTSALQEGTLVKFELMKYDNQFRARNLQLLNLNEEVDSDIIERCLNQSDPKFCALGFYGYLNNNSIEQATTLANKKLNNFLEWQKKRFVRYLPQPILLSYHNQNLRKFLPHEQHLICCLNILNDNLTPDVNTTLKKEIFSLIENLQDLDLRIWEQIPKELYILYIRFPENRKRLNPKLRLECLIELISNVDDFTRTTLLTELRDCLIESKDNFLWKNIPDDILIEEQIWNIAPRNRRTSLLISQIRDNSKLENEDIILKISEIMAESQSEERQFLISLIPKDKDWIKGNDAIFKFLHPSEKICILLKKLQEEQSENQDLILKIGNAIAEVSEEERTVVIYILPEWLRYKEPILNLIHSLPPDEQVNIVWWSLKESGFLSVWSYLSRLAKILCIYRFAKESQNISIVLTRLKELQKNNPENDYLVRSVLKLLWAKEHPERGDEVFQQVDEFLIKYVIEQAKNTTELLNLDPLLPECKIEEVTVKYCEGKLWQIKEETCAYCPRARKRCDLFEPNKRVNANYNLYGARIYAECSQDWRDWSLLELFKVAGIQPSLPGLLKPEDYVPKLAGWINRINEIRSRLKCSVCGEIMPHNIEYAKFTAKFRVTVFSCKHGSGHDHNIYLNECWGCGEIIDSRESKYQSPEDNYYICIHCGSGTQYSNSYTQGDICPKCGTQGMKVSEWSRYRHCQSCNHSIKLPDEKKITGSICPECGTKGMILLVNQNNEQIRRCRSQSCELSINLFTKK